MSRSAIVRKSNEMIDRLCRPQTRVFLAAVLIGVITGFLASVLKVVIGYVAGSFTSGFSGPLDYWLLVIPVAGILLAVAYQKYAEKRDLGDSVRDLSHNLHDRRYYMSPSLMYAWMVGGTLTLGFGGSAGSEGPIASTGAAVGSNIGRWLRMPPDVMRILIGCGAGAGIAGIFKAPLGGMLFTLEVLKVEISTMAVMAVLAACVAAFVTAYALSGFTFDMSYLNIEAFDPAQLPLFVLLGLFCGLYSLYYSGIMQGLANFFGRIGCVWLRALCGGAILAVIVFMLPAMYGEGYGVIADILNGREHVIIKNGIFGILEHGEAMTAVCAGLILLLKPAACASSNSDGGVAGDFAPALYAGCFAGVCFAMVARMCGLHVPVAPFAYVGMAGVMSGVIRAPFMAIFLVAEMCGGVGLILPITVVSVFSFWTVRLFRTTDYYQRI